MNCYIDGERVVVLHAFITKTRATPERHLRLARRRRGDEVPAALPEEVAPSC